MMLWMLALVPPALADPPDRADPTGPPDLPELLSPTDPALDCVWTRRIGAPEDSPCMHSGTSRAALLGIGAVTAGAGTLWFLSGGDSYRSGDPAGQAIGIGLVAAGGAVLGGVSRALSQRQADARVPDRPARATVRLTLGLGGSPVTDEAVPAAVGVTLDPTFRLSDRIQIQPHLGIHPGLGTAVDVDPRPQHTAPIDGQDGAFPIARRLRSTRASVGAELAWRTRAPRPEARPRLEVRWRPTLEIRHRTLQPGTPDVQRLQHLALMPANLGLRWHVTPRQRFTWFLGPRIDWIGFSAPGDTALVGPGRPVMGPIYGEAFYQIDMPISRGAGPWNVTGRFNLGYLHTNLDGQSLDLGAIIGFFGPVDVSYDVRFRRGGAAQAWQLTLGQRLGHGGGTTLALGAVLGGAR